MNTDILALRAISAGHVEYSDATRDAHWAGGTICADTICGLESAGLIRIAGMRWVNLTTRGWAEVYRADAEEAA